MYFRYLTMSAQEFKRGVAGKGLLTTQVLWLNMIHMVHNIMNFLMSDKINLVTEYKTYFRVK